MLKSAKRGACALSHDNLKLRSVQYKLLTILRTVDLNRVLWFWYFCNMKKSLMLTKTKIRFRRVFATKLSFKVAASEAPKEVHVMTGDDCLRI